MNDIIKLLEAMEFDEGLGYSRENRERRDQVLVILNAQQPKCERCGGNPRGVPAKGGGWTTCPSCQQPSGDLVKELRNIIERYEVGLKDESGLLDFAKQAAARISALEGACRDIVNLACISMVVSLLNQTADEAKDKKQAGLFRGSAIILGKLQERTKAALIAKESNEQDA